MPVSEPLAHLSNSLFVAAIAAYSVGLVFFCGEYAFGRIGRVARTAVDRAAAPARVLVGAGGAAGTAASAGPAGAPPTARMPGSRDELDPDAGKRVRARQFGRIAVAALLVGVPLQLTSICLRGAAVDRVPWGNMYEFSSLATVIAVAAFLAVLIRQPRLRYLGGFVLLPVLVLMFLAGTVLYAKADPLVPALHSYWLAIHVSAAAIGTGIFMVSSVATILYLVRARFETVTAAGGQPGFTGALGQRLPESGGLDRMAYRLAAFAFPIYTFAVICGAIWAEAAWGKYWSWDPKETWAFITWVIYAAYLHARSTAGWKGTKASVINLLGFGAMVFNFFVVNIVVSGLHSYAGLN